MKYLNKKGYIFNTLNKAIEDKLYDKKFVSTIKNKIIQITVIYFKT